MNIKSDNRPLLIDFEIHTDGDSIFKKELIELMIDDIDELQRSLDIVVKQNDLEVYRKTCHKIVGTLSLLADKEFTDAIETLKTQNTDQHVILLKSIIYGILKSLHAELETVNGS